MAKSVKRFKGFVTGLMKNALKKKRFINRRLFQFFMAYGVSFESKPVGEGDGSALSVSLYHGLFREELLHSSDYPLRGITPKFELAASANLFLNKDGSYSRESHVCLVDGQGVNVKLEQIKGKHMPIHELIGEIKKAYGQDRVVIADAHQHPQIDSAANCDGKSVFQFYILEGLEEAIRDSGTSSVDIAKIISSSWDG